MAQFRKWLLLLMALGMSTLFAQHATFVGIITDEYAQPIDNVVVTVVGADLSTVSSETGMFELKVPAERELQIHLQHLSYRDTTLIVTLRKNQRERRMITLLSTGEQLEMVDVRGRGDDGFTRVDPNLTFKLPSPTEHSLDGEAPASKQSGIR